MLTPYVMRTPKASFLCYSNKYLYTKLFIINNEVPANMRIFSDNWPILRKNSSASMAKLVEAENEAILVEVENGT